MEKINEAWKNASEELYKAQQEQGAPSEPQAEAGDASAAEDVTDVEFEEVKDDK